MRIEDATRWLEASMNLKWAEPWDNVGLLLGDENSTLNKAIFCINATREVVLDAIAQEAQLLVAYHPPLFKGVKRFAANDPVYLAARAGLAIWSPHTAFDVAHGGTNDVLAEALSLSNVAPLRTTPSTAPLGIGRIGDLSAPRSSHALVAALRSQLGVSHVLVGLAHERDVTRVAVAAGSGSELIADALAAGARAFITGELRHHDALAAIHAGLDVYCVLHSNSERVALSRLCVRARQALSISCSMSPVDRDPFEIR